MKRHLVCLAAGSAAMLGLSGAAEAQSYDGFYYSYAVKVVCGYYEEEDEYPAVAPGQYYTAVNVANTNEKDVEYEYTFTPTHDWDLGDYGVSDRETFDGYEGKEFDCWELFGRDDKYDYESGDYPFYKGILYIWSKRRLDVWGVYTAKYCSDGGSSRDCDDGYYYGYDNEQVYGRKVSSRGWGSDLGD